MDLPGRLLWLATVVWTASHPTLLGYLVAIAATVVLAVYDRCRSVRVGPPPAAPSGGADGRPARPVPGMR